MSLDFCSNCGCWIGSQQGIIRLSKDGNAEIICNECLAIEQATASFSVDMGTAKLESTGFIEQQACESFR